MFVRYLGGGIGHLEQFPPANNDDEDPGHIDEDEDEDKDKDDSEDPEDGDNLDPGESLDEETGNVY